MCDLFNYLILFDVFNPIYVFWINLIYYCLIIYIELLTDIIIG